MERNKAGDKKTDAGRSTDTDQHQRRQKKPISSSSSLDVELKLGWDHASRQSVALKTYRTDPYVFEDHPCRQLVEYEIKSMDRISFHHNIVRLVEVMVRSPSNVCLVMEAAAGSRGNLMETISAASNGK